MIGLLRRVRASRASGVRDAGTSLVELSTAMVITGLLMAAIATVTIGTLRSVRTVTSKISTAADARLAMESMSRTLRMAATPSGLSAAIDTANANSIIFYSKIDRPNALTVSNDIIPTKVEYYLSGSCLMEAFTPARVNGSAYAWDTGRTTRCVVRTSSAPVFSYYVSGSTATALSTPVTGSNLATIQSIQVAMTVTDPGNTGVGGVPANVRVTLTNVVLAAGGTA